MNNNHKKYLYLITTVVLLLSTTLSAFAQRVTLPAQYFFNQYLSNAAMAGADSSLNIMASYNKQLDNIPGAPVNVAFAADYNVGKRVGLGVNVFNQKAGILNQTRAALTYAYHLPVGRDGQRLSFGISAAVVNSNVSLSHVEGEQADPSLLDYNARGVKMDGDLGIAYLSNTWNFQVALPSIRDYAEKEAKNSVDRPALYAATSYLFYFDNEINSVQPKLAYTQIKGFKDILDIGVEVKGFNNVAGVQAIYHSSGSFTAGVGIEVLSRINLMAAYTTQSKEMRAYANGIFSVNAKIALFPRSAE